MSSDFCIGSAIQLSLDFFCATPACACHSPGSVNQDCEIYGGQCPCIDVEAGFAPVRGRQCNLCPFYSYLTPSGCTCKLFTQYISRSTKESILLKYSTVFAGVYVSVATFIRVPCVLYEYYTTSRVNDHDLVYKSRFRH